MCVAQEDSCGWFAGFLSFQIVKVLVSLVIFFSPFSEAFAARDAENACIAYKAAKEKYLVLQKQLGKTRSAYSKAQIDRKAALKEWRELKAVEESQMTEITSLANAMARQDKYRLSNDNHSEDWNILKSKLEGLEAENRFVKLKLDSVGKAESNTYDRWKDLKEKLLQIQGDILRAAKEMEYLKEQCDAKDTPDQSAKPTKNPPQSDPSVSKGTPSGFRVTTNCPPCEATASLLNDIAGSIPAIEDELDEAKKALARYEKTTRVLEGIYKINFRKYRKALDKLHEITNSLSAIQKSPDQSQEYLTTKNEFYNRGLINDSWEIKLRDRYNETYWKRQRVKALQGELNDLKAQENSLRRKLADCEKLCSVPAPAPEKPVGGPSDVGTTPQTYKPAYTSCRECEPVVSRLNDVLGTLVVTRRSLAEALKARDKIIEKRTAAQKALQKAQGDASKTYNEQFERTGATKAVRKARARAALNNMFNIEDSLRKLNKQVANKEAAVTAFAQQVSDLENEEKKLKKELAACEKLCLVHTVEPAQKPKPAGVDYDPVITSCQACEFEASLLNDIIGTISATETALKNADADLSYLQFIEDKVYRELQAAEAAFNPLFAEMATLKKAGKDSTDVQARLEDQIRQANRKLVESNDASSAVADKEIEIEDLEKKLATWKAKEAMQRKKLRACEKLCKKPNGITGESPAEEKITTTVCIECNDKKTELSRTRESIKTIRRQIIELQDRLAEEIRLEQEESAAVGKCKLVCTEEGTVSRNSSFVPDQAAPLSRRLSQPEKCLPGKKCSVVIGPGWLETDKAKRSFILINTIVKTTNESNLYCAQAGRTKSICTNKNGAAGSGNVFNAAKSETLSFILSEKMKSLPGFCIRPLEMTEKNSKKFLIQTIQLGLRLNGINIGKADGIYGRKTRAGIRRFGDGRKDFDPRDLDKLFRLLYGVSSERYINNSVMTTARCLSVEMKKTERRIKEKSKRKVLAPKSPKKHATTRRKKKDTLRKLAPIIGTGVFIGSKKFKRRKNRQQEENW